MQRLAFVGLWAGSTFLAAASDPMLNYVAVLSGGNLPLIARDGAGNIYAAGTTFSSAFPAASGAYQPAYQFGACVRGSGPGGPCYDMFVAKWDPSGTRLLWATYLGGSADEFLGGMTVDASGNVYLTGWTSSSDFPVTAGAFQTRYRGSVFSEWTMTGDAFVAKLNSSGSALSYSTFLGGATSDAGAAIAVDAAGNAYVTGGTDSTDFPVTPNAFQRANRGNNVFVSKLNAAGSALVFSTYLGGSGMDYGRAIAVDGSGVVYVGGTTRSADFPVTAGAFQTRLRDGASFIGGGDSFLARIAASGSVLLSSTYFGGGRGEMLSGIALDPSGRIYIAGSTDSSDLPVTAGALKNAIGEGVCSGDGQGNLIPCADVFVAGFDSSGTRLTYSTYLGGTSAEGSPAAAIDKEGILYLAGTTGSADFPTTPDAFQSCSRGRGYSAAAFAMKFKPGGPLLYSTFLGGSGGASAHGLAVDANGGVYIAGDLPPFYMSIPGRTGFFVPSNDFPPSPVPLISFGASEPSGAFVSMLDPSRGAPSMRISCVVDAASLLGGPITPGELVEIRGKQLGPEEALSAQWTPHDSIGASLGGVEVFFGTFRAAPLLSVQAGRIRALVPYEPFSNGNIQTTIEVRYRGRTTGLFPVNVAPAAPAIFSLDGSGNGQAAVLNEDGTLNSTGNPAPKGSVISIFCTGLGAVRGQAVDGSRNRDGRLAPVGEVDVTIGGWPAEVLFAGSAPGQVFGVFQVNARVPTQPPSGTARIAVAVRFGLAGGFYSNVADVGLGRVHVNIQ